MRALKKTIILAAVILAGCGKAEKGFDNYLKLRLVDDPTTLDPALIVDVPGGALSAKIFNGLVRYDSDGRVVPDIASAWEVSPDGRTYRFQLQEGVSFHNGREVTAQDFVYSLRRLLDPAVASPREWLLSGVTGTPEFRAGRAASVAGIRAAGERVLEIELNQPSGLFLSLLAMPNASVVPREEVERWGAAFSDHPCGTGPFRLREWRHNDRIVLRRNDGYFRGPARLAGVLYRVIPEDLTAAVEFERGNLDLLEVPRAEFKRFTTTTPFKERIESQVGLNIYYLGFNCRKAPFDDPRLRRAFNYALDREKIIASLLEGRALAASGPVPPALLSPASGGYPYDPEKAKDLLRECGVTLPLKAELLLKSDREALSVAEVIQDYLKRVGVELVLVQREWSAFKEAVDRGEFDLFYLSWWGDYPEAENFLFPTFHSSNWGPGGNRARFRDEEVDAWLERARVTTSPEASRALYVKTQERVFELAPWVFLWHKKDFVVASPRVKNFRLPLVYNGDRLEEIELAGE